MRGYSIDDLEKLSGIKAHTIRIWEKRYHLLTPSRTDTNIRYYSDDDLKKLLNVSVLTGHGMKISKISKHTDYQLHEKVKALVEKPEESDAVYKAYYHSMIGAIMKYNEKDFDKSWLLCIRNFGLYNTVKQVLYPLLTRVGLMWRVDELYPAQEHFLSCLIARKLLAVTDSLKTKIRAGKTVLLFLHEEELHEIPLIFSNYLLRHHGIATIYLGARVPIQNLKKVIEECEPSALMTFFTTKHSLNFFADYLNQLKKVVAHREIFIGGNPFFFNLSRLPQQVKWMNSIADFENEFSLRPLPSKKYLSHEK